MGRECSKLEQDLEGLRRRIQTSRKRLRDAEIRARHLQSSIETALLAPEMAEREKQKTLRRLNGRRL